MFLCTAVSIQNIFYKVNDQLIPCVNVTTHEVVEPLYQFQETAHFSSTSEVIDAMKIFGYESFKMKQEECIMRILSGKYI